MINKDIILYVVTRLQISASDYNTNGNSDVRVFFEREKAHRLFKQWREEELQFRDDTEVAYKVYSDSNDRFHCAWDSDLEMLIVTLKECKVQ